MATLPLQGFIARTEKIIASLTSRTPEMPSTENAPEKGSAERDFIKEVIWSNPSAFSGDLDIQHMMQMFPGRF